MRLAFLMHLALLTACTGPASAPAVGVRIQGEYAEIIRGEGEDETGLALFRGVCRWAAGDVTGDGRPELVLLWALPDRPPRVWVVRPGDGGVTPIWRGSGMAGIPLDIALAPPVAGRTPLVVLEDWGDGLRLVLYRWDAFGFRGTAWGAVDPGALAVTDAGVGYQPDGREAPCALEVTGRQVLLRCPRN